jgi:hypothetical protein
LDYLATRTSLSPIRRGFAPGFANYKKWCTRLAGASDKVYQLLVHGRWFSPGTPASSNIAEILLKVALSTINQSLSHCDYIDIEILHLIKFLLLQVIQLGQNPLFQGQQVVLQALPNGQIIQGQPIQIQGQTAQFPQQVY